MTEERYWYVRREYGIASSHFPSADEIAGMTEQGLRESLGAVRAMLNGIKEERGNNDRK